MKSLLRYVAPLVATLLAGCWSSYTPLMPANTFDKVPLKGRYTSMPKSGGIPTTYEMSADGKVVVAIPELERGDKAKHFRMSFDLLQKNIYLVQISDGNNVLRGYRIHVFDKQGNMKSYEPPCEFPESAMPGVKKDGSTCYFADYKTLLDSAKARAKGIAGGLGESYAADQYQPVGSGK